MSNCAGIVFGRTYEVDFRFIATPEDFTVKEKIWAETHIRVTTRSAEKLREHSPRWSVFSNERICIVGVTCMAYTLSEDMTQDSKPRQLYLFAGYVSRYPFDSLPPMDIELFKPLYQYVRDKWGEKPYDRSREVPFSTEYKALVYPDLIPTLDFDEDYFSLNQTNSQIARLWPDSASNQESLWTAASQAKFPSLCLGLATQSDALKESPFLNAVAVDVMQKDDLPKQIPTTVRREDVRQPPASNETFNREIDEPESTQENLLPLELGHPGIALGAAVGATVGAKLGLPGMLVGAGVGLLAGGWLSYSGIGGQLRETTDELLTGSKSKRHFSTPQDGMEGFRRKSPSDSAQDDRNNW